VDAFIAVLGTLLGGVLGAVGSYVNQKAAHRSEAGERLAAMRLQVYLDYLAAVHELYGQVDDVHKAHHDGAVGDEVASQQLRGVTSRPTMTALENVRLVASDGALARAEELFELMRREKPPLGQDLSWPVYRDWQKKYWKARKELTEVARSELGFDDHDRHAAPAT
jgi:hypothetical protein